MSSVVLIPARSGSTRVLNKNLVLLGPHPLIAHSIIASKQTRADRVIVSTNSEEIAAVAVGYGAEVPFIRPDNLATSESTSISVILHALTEFHSNSYFPDTIIFKPPTNPFLTPQTMDKMLEMKQNDPLTDSILSIFEPRTSALSYIDFDPLSNHVTPGVYEINGKHLFDFERSQDRPPSYAASPACKVTSTEYFIVKYLTLHHGRLPQLSSMIGPTYNPSSCKGFLINQFEAQDIDDSNDLDYSRYLLAQQLL